MRETRKYLEEYERKDWNENFKKNERNTNGFIHGKSVWMA
jgi:hypothetical protein